MARGSLVLFSCSLIAVCPFAKADPPVTAALSLQPQQSVYKIGDPILLRLTFTANQPGFQLNETVTQPASPIDELLVSPMAGVHPWLADQARGNPYAPDFAAMRNLEAGRTQSLTLPLNAVYRFDAAGHYKVHVITRRVVRGTPGQLDTSLPLATNEVEFDIVPIDPAEEAARAALIEHQIRSASTIQTAQHFAENLDWLTGDPSTRVKLSLFLNPKVLTPFSVDVSRGLWIARNRTLIVQQLDAALRNPNEALVSESLSLLVQLKARLQVPFHSDTPDAPLPTEGIEREYVTLIAASLSERKGDPLIEAAKTVFSYAAGHNEVTLPEFTPAREAIITHFDDIGDYTLDWFLNTFGDFLKDDRIVPPLVKVIEAPASAPNPANMNRDPALKQLIKIDPAIGRREFVKEVCGTNPMLPFLDETPFDSLPEADDCIKRHILQAVLKVRRNPLMLQFAARFAARFASANIYDDLLNLYNESGDQWEKQTQGLVLGYLGRWDFDRALPLWEKALPANAAELDFAMLLGLEEGTVPDSVRFWRERLLNAPPKQAGQAAWILSEFAPKQEQIVIRSRLDRWRDQWKAQTIPDDEGSLEADLVDALAERKNWKMSKAEAAKLQNACLSNVCKSRVRP